MTKDKLPSQLYLNHIWNEWSPYLTDTEFKIVLFIFMRTIRYNKVEEDIPIRHFIDGVSETVGLGITERTLYRVLKTLKSKNVINVSGVKGCKNTYSLNLGIGAKNLRMGREKSKNTPDTSDRGILTPVSGVYITTLYSNGRISKNTHFVRRQEKISGSKKEDNMVDMDYLKSIGKDVSKKSKNLRMENKKKFSKTSLWKIWEDSMKEYHPSAPLVLWKAYEAKHIHDLCKKNLAGSSYQDFLETVVAEWNAILQLRLSYLKSKPAYPTVGFLVKFFPEFIEGFLRVTNDESLQQLPPSQPKPKKESSAAGIPATASADQTLKLIHLQKQLKASKARESQMAEKLLQEREKNKCASQTKKIRVGKQSRKLRLDNLPDWDDE